MKHINREENIFDEGAGLFPPITITFHICGKTIVRFRGSERISRPTWRFYWYPEGGAGVEFQGKIHESGPDEILAIPPNTPIRHILRKPCQHFYIHANMGQPFDSFSGQVLRVNVDNNLKVILRDLNVIDFSSERCKLTINAFCFEVLRKIPDETWPKTPADPRVKRILAHINDSPDKNLENAKLAKLAGMSTNAFTRLFRRQIGDSPNSYVITCRLQLACHQLLHTSKSIEEIATDCGFGDRNYLSRLFKKKLNSSPAFYRRTAGLPENV